MRPRAYFTAILLAFDVGLIAGQEGSDAEAFQKACNSGNTRACRELGLLYAKGNGVPKDATKAVQLYQSACDGGDANGCYWLGFHYVLGAGVPKDSFKATQLNQKACDGGVMSACVALGGMYADGSGVTKDPAKAAELFKKGCDGGSANACFSLGETYLHGKGVARDLATATRLYKSACDGGDANGCYWLGKIHAINGNPSKSVEPYQKACEGSIGDACVELADVYTEGEGIPQDLARAAQLFQRACDDGHRGACYFLGGVYEYGKGVSKDVAKAVQFYEKGCEAGHIYACSALGAVYHAGNGIPKDLVRAARAYQRACDAGNADSCRELGVDYYYGSGVPKDLAKATLLYQKACDGGSNAGCLFLGNSYRAGEGIRMDPIRAAQLYERVCSAGDALLGEPLDDALPVACFNLGVSYATGQGVLVSAAAAAEAYHKAGLAFLKGGRRADALRCVERIQNLTQQGLNVPNAFLADQLLKTIYQPSDPERVPPTNRAPSDPQPTERATTTKFGTGWVVRSDLVVTNHHVVSGAKRIRLLLEGGVLLDARVVVSDATNDLVLLKPTTRGQLPPPLPLADQPPRSGDTVFTIGHPYPTLLGSEAKVTDGVISSTSGIANDPRLLQVSVPIQPGNSGGPLLGMHGQVVGVVISKLNAAKVFRWSGDLPENVGYAIKVAYLLPLLPSPPQQEYPTGVRGLADLVAGARPSVVLVVAE